MPKLPLTLKQQELLRVTSPLLDNGDIGPSWVLFRDRSKIMSIISLPKNGQFPPEWNNADDGDIEAFIECGLMRATNREPWGGAKNLTVFVQKISQAVKTDFDDPHTQPQSVSKTINIHGNVTGSQVGIDTNFENIRVKIEASPSFPDDKKESLENVVRRLLTEAVKLDEGEDKEAILECTQSVVDEIHKEKPNKHTIAGNKNALQKAADNLQIVAPVVFSLAGQFILLLEHIKYHP